jgi:hypothetical protein
LVEAISNESDIDGLDAITDLFVIPVITYIEENLTPVNIILYLSIPSPKFYKIVLSARYGIIQIVKTVHIVVILAYRKIGEGIDLLIKYKRWVEWFAGKELNTAYSNGGNEDCLELSLRKFLFENGIEFPFSQSATPGGKADIVAGLETREPLVLEVKIWDTKKKYGENRIRDGLRQIVKYADDYGKSIGYVVVFNLDEQPLVLTSQSTKNKFPPSIITKWQDLLFPSNQYI